jgi:hypothetical protein
MFGMVRSSTDSAGVFTSRSSASTFGKGLC